MKKVYIIIIALLVFACGDSITEKESIVPLLIFRPLEVVYTSPSNNETGVLTNRAFLITFSKELDENTISGDTVKVKRDLDKSVVTGDIGIYQNKMILFKPDQGLHGNEIYNIVLSKDIADSDGLSFETGYQLSFSTGSTLDLQGPMVKLTDPEDKDFIHAADAVIKVEFNEDVHPSTINSSTFYIKKNGINIDGVVTYDAATRTANFKPDKLGNGCIFEVFLTNAVRDLAGNSLEPSTGLTWYFRTGLSGDNIPPEILSVNPAPGSVSGSGPVEIRALFSEKLDLNTVNPLNVAVMEGESPVPGSVTFDNEANAVIFQSRGSLRNSTHYDVTISRGVKDRSLNPMESDYTWSFSTGPVDTDPPFIISTSPLNGQVLPVSAGMVTAVFSEDLHGPSVTQENFNVTCNGNPVDGTVAYIDTTRTVVFIPAEPMVPHLEYRVKIPAGGIQDASFNVVSADYAWNFSTGAVAVYNEEGSNVLSAMASFGDPDGTGPAHLGWQLRLEDGSIISGYGLSLADIFDAGSSGMMVPGRAFRIVENGRNITDPAGLALTPVSQSLERYISPPADQCYIDPVLGKYVLPQPIFWSTWDNSEHVLFPELYVSNFLPYCDNEDLEIIEGKINQCNYVQSGLFSALSSNFYPFGEQVMPGINSGTISVWTKLKVDAVADAALRIYLNESVSINLVYKWNTNYAELLIDGAAERSEGCLGNDEWHHVYVVWNSAGLADGATIKVFLDGSPQPAVLSSLVIPEDDYEIRTSQSATNIVLSTASSSMDNLKIWNHAVSESPQWIYNYEYNNGNEGELNTHSGALHVIYDSGNGYRPVLTGPGNGVSYYRLP